MVLQLRSSLQERGNRWRTLSQAAASGLNTDRHFSTCERAVRYTPRQGILPANEKAACCGEIVYGGRIRVGGLRFP
jgi:hydrogenase maturation factor